MKLGHHLIIIYNTRRHLHHTQTTAQYRSEVNEKKNFCTRSAQTHVLLVFLFFNLQLDEIHEIMGSLFSKLFLNSIYDSKLIHFREFMVLKASSVISVQDNTLSSFLIYLLLLWYWGNKSHGKMPYPSELLQS